MEKYSDIPAEKIAGGTQCSNAWWNGDFFCKPGCKETTRGEIEAGTLCPWGVDKEWTLAKKECTCYV